MSASLEEGGVVFDVWAPAVPRLRVEIDRLGRHAMARAEDGHHRVTVKEARAGDRYWFRFDDGRRRADPASRCQPEGVDGPSEVIDPRAFAWTDAAWPGVADPARQVIYEMHVGTFTPEGTWRAAIPHLGHLAALGMTTIEMMPVSAFAGRFGWGYDGVFWFAPTHLYGRPADLAAFVDAAHGLGLAVILDVVYNHLGPVGNVMREFAPAFFSAEHKTDWGEAINFDGAGSRDVRGFVLDNVRWWINAFHFDGLRLDATFQYVDTSPTPIVHEIARVARGAAGRRRVFLSAENEPQDVAELRTAARDGCDALFNEDWHHVAMAALTGRRDGYLTDYEGTAREFAAMARHGFLYQGQWYTWQQKGRGTRSRGLPRGAVVQFLQNHDQVANLAHGERPERRADAGLWRALSALLLLSPGLPLIFQGQEFGAMTPFRYFADLGEGLADAIRDGRRTFLEQFPANRDPDVRARIPDPADPATFDASRLRRDEGVAAVTALYRDLLARRRDDPVVNAINTGEVEVDATALDDALLVLRLEHVSAGSRLLVVNLGPLRSLALMNDPLLAPPPREAAWQLLWSSEAAEYGGRGVQPFGAEPPWVIPPRSATLLGNGPAPPGAGPVV